MADRNRLRQARWISLTPCLVLLALSCRSDAKSSGVSSSISTSAKFESAHFLCNRVVEGGPGGNRPLVQSEVWMRSDRALITSRSIHVLRLGKGDLFLVRRTIAGWEVRSAACRRADSLRALRRLRLSRRSLSRPGKAEQSGHSRRPPLPQLPMPGRLRWQHEDVLLRDGSSRLPGSRADCLSRSHDRDLYGEVSRGSWLVSGFEVRAARRHRVRADQDRFVGTSLQLCSRAPGQAGVMRRVRRHFLG